MVRKHSIQKKRSSRDNRAKKATKIYGFHAVAAALLNPKRQNFELFATVEALETLKTKRDCWSDMALKAMTKANLMNREEINKLMPQGSAHQGVVLSVDALPNLNLKDILYSQNSNIGPIVVLDQVTDPQNVGTIMRSALSFGAKAIVMQSRHSPDITGALAKAASGALESLPMIYVSNLSRAIDELKNAGFWVIGLDTKGDTELEQAFTNAPTVIVLGSEGRGLRRLTSERCDIIAQIKMANSDRSQNVTSINVSNAAAIALYKAQK